MTAESVWQKDKVNWGHSEEANLQDQAEFKPSYLQDNRTNVSHNGGRSKMKVSKD